MHGGTATPTPRRARRRRAVADRDLASEVTRSVDPTSPLRVAAGVMERRGVSSLLVGDGGIVTERDLVRAMSHGIPPTEPVGEVATAHPVVVSGAVSVVDGCATMLAEQVRHLVVDIGGGRLGIVSMRDVLSVLIHSATPHVWLTSLRLSVPDASDTTEIWLG